MQEDAIKYTFDAWNYESNITDETEKVYTKAQEVSSALTNRLGKEAQNYEISKIQDYDVQRKLKLMKNIGTSILPQAEWSTSMSRSRPRNCYASSLMP